MCPMDPLERTAEILDQPVEWQIESPAPSN
jgi:hypothetical protein